AAALAWAGALALGAAHLQAGRAQSLLGFARWVSLAQAAGLLLSAGLLARAPDAFGALDGAVLAAGLPTLGLLAVAGLAAEAGDPETRWASCAGLAGRNRALVGALALSLLALAGLPLTIGFAAKVRLIQSGASTGQLLPVGLALLNAVVLAGLSLWVLRPLTHHEAREREPWVGDSATTLLCLGACAGVLAGGLWWPGLGAGG
ncbi:MAG TPA: hypothetical protein DEA08_26960, partial [Planctomycetes bacterium]|nr:hypothetical protein [Planctomycetota bacterium]